MINKLYKKIKNTFFLDSGEKNFINYYNFKNNNIKSNNKKNILFNATEDYKTICFIASLIKDNYLNNKNIILFLPLLSWHRSNHKKNIFIFIFKFYLNQFILFLRNKKWKKIYNNFSKNFITFNNYNIINEIKYLNKAEKILISKIKTKKDLQNLKINGILVGDLVYDTYLRFNERTSVNLKDIFLIEVLAKTIHSLEKINKKKLIFDEIYTNQLAYIYHGLLVRKYKRQQTRIFNFMWTAGPHFAPISRYFHLYDFMKYKSLFKKEKNKIKKLNEAKLLLKTKFKGKIIPQENFMPLSPYKNKNHFLPDILGTVFLHCFVDSPTSRGNCIFIDFEEWIIETLEYFKKKKISHRIAIKPHPDSKEASLSLINKLKINYPEFIWLNKNFSNKIIFNKKPLFGLTVMGTVLHELAYHDIIPISAGENSTINYNFVRTANTKKKYFKLINSVLQKKISYKSNKKQILEWVYMTYIYDKSPNKMFHNKIKLKTWNFKKSDVLIKLLNSLS